MTDPIHDHCRVVGCACGGAERAADPTDLTPGEQAAAREVDQWRSYAGELARVLESMDVDASTLAALAIVAPDAIDAAHCKHGRVYPDCALCHRTGGGAPVIDDLPGLHSGLAPREGDANAAERCHVENLEGGEIVTHAADCDSLRCGYSTVVPPNTEPLVIQINPEPVDGSHRYLSTGCLHGDHVLDDGRTGHEYCQSDTGHAGSKRAGRCKFCDAACVCPCHKKDAIT